MGYIQLQMVDHSVSTSWWKELMLYFLREGDDLELRCWREENWEIEQASRYGNPVEDHYEVSVRGKVTREWMAELLAEEPNDKSIYNKMTKYFTINANHGQRSVCSAHYGTEFYVNGATEEDISFFRKVMDPYGEDFSTSVEL